MARYTAVVSVIVSLFIFLFGNLSEAISTELEQTISGFNLSGFAEQGKKAWEIESRSADIFSDRIILNDFTGTIYDEEKIVITAQKGSFNRIENQVHLEEDVVITTESGARLSTDYLDWDQESSQVVTEAAVNIKKDNIVTSAVGIKGNTDLKNVNLEKDVEVQIDDRQNKIIITCQGPLKINYAKNLAVFNKDVFVDDGQSQMQADLMEVFFTSSSSGGSGGVFAGRDASIDKIIARGNVKIIRQGNISFSDEAEYNAADKTIVLKGRPKLIIYSAEDMNAPFGS